MANILSLSPDILARFLVDPKSAATEFGIDDSNVEDIRRLELFCKVAGENVKAAAAVAQINAPQLAWGIGAGCCNDKTFVAQ